MTKVQCLRPNTALFCSMLTMVLIISPVAGLSSILVMYMTSALHMGEAQSSSQFAAFIALLFSFCVVGGAYGSRYSYFIGLVVGLLVLCFGGVLLFFKLNLVLGLTLAIGGYGFAFPNFIAIFGQTLPENETTTDTRFIINYMCMNLGGLLGIGVGVISKLWFNDQLYFAYISVCALISVSMITWLYPRLPFPRAETPCLIQDKHGSRAYNLLILAIVLVISAILLDVGLSHVSLANGLLAFVTVVSYLYVILIARKYSKASRLKIYFFLFLTFVTMIFFTLYSIEPSVLALFIHHYVNRAVLGLSFPASGYFILNPVFNLLVGSFIITMLLKSKKIPKADNRVYLGLFFMGIAFCVLWYCSKFTYSSAGVSTWWIVLAYFFLSGAEMILAPVAYAIVFELGVPELYGVMSGMTQMAIGVGAVFSEKLVSITIPQKHMLGQKAGLLFYIHGFGVVAFVWVVLGIFFLMFGPLVRRLVPLGPGKSNL